MLPPEAERVLDGWRAAGMPFTSRPHYVSDMPGGRTNRSFLVEADGVPHVLRIGSPDVDALGIDRGREARALSLAADADLAPPVAWADPVRGWLLTRFVDGERRVAGGLDDDALDALLERLGNVHALDAGLAAFDYPRHFLRFFSPDARAAGLPAGVERGLEAIGRRSERALVHHDPAPGNVIFAPEGPLLIDWEYAACGFPVFDHASVVVDWAVPAGKVAAGTGTHPALLDDACALYVELCDRWEDARRAK